MPRTSPSVTSTPVVRTQTGKVLCWGSNWDGQMGDGTWGKDNVRVRPGEVEALSGATEVYVSHRSTCGRMAGGRLRCVGGGGPMVWGARRLGGGDADLALPELIQELRSGGSTSEAFGCAR